MTDPLTVTAYYEDNGWLLTLPELARPVRTTRLADMWGKLAASVELTDTHVYDAILDGPTRVIFPDPCSLLGGVGAQELVDVRTRGSRSELIVTYDIDERDRQLTISHVMYEESLPLEERVLAVSLDLSSAEWLTLRLRYADTFLPDPYAGVAPLSW